MRRSRTDTDASQKKISRRAALLGGAQLLFVGGLAARMRYLQVDQADQFRLLAEENRINVRLIPPARGEVFDRNGQRLAQNMPSYRIVIVREDAGDIDVVLDRLALLIDMDTVTLEQTRKELHRATPFLPFTVIDDVSWATVSKVSVNAPALPGVTPEVGLTRAYPRGSDFAHLLGYVGPVSDYDLNRLEDPDPLLRIPRFQIGKIGVEAKAEMPLRGKAGAKRVEVNAAGRVMRELDRQEGRAGSDLQLTVDSDLQRYLQARLSTERSASAVVLDCETGDVLACASTPTFDPNLFVRGISVANYKALQDPELRPLASKAVQDAQPPGSTFKMITALAAIEDGITDPGSTTYCRGHLEVADRRFHCWKRAGHGSMDLENSLKQSCDVYYYDLALKVGIEKISAMARRFGLGVRHDLPMSAVSRGLAPTKAWKKSTYGQEWRIGDTVNASIGQGYMLATPMQLAVMTARLATGHEIRPRLIKSIDGVEQPSGFGPSLGVNENNLRKIRKAMYAVVNDRRGTAYKSRIIGDGERMAGKTGTSQVRSQVVKNSDVEWKLRDHALFVNFAPFDSPKYAVAILVEHGGGGSSTAAPIARDITLQALHGGEPPLESYPDAARAAARTRQRMIRALQPEANFAGRDAQDKA